jgi:LPS O-antigen subunit length determinant protein (WzzB/FepE family)
MNSETDGPSSNAARDREDRPVLGYFVPVPAHDVRDDLALSALFRQCWRGRWIIFGCTFVVAALFIAWATFSGKYYRATAVVSIVRPDGNVDGGAGLGGQLGALAAAAGLRAGNANANREEFIAFLKSRRLQARFIESENLLPVLYADRWDSTKQAWKSADPSQVPSLDEAVEKLRRELIDIEIDKVTGLLSVSFEARDRRAVAKWTTNYIDLANRAIRGRTTAESERSLEFLNRELQETQPVAVQQAIYGLIQSQLNSKMLASVREEYAFRTIDNATEPSVKRPERPVRRAYAVVGAFLGMLLGAILAIWRARKSRT